MGRPLPFHEGKNHIYHNWTSVKRRKCLNSMEKPTLYLVPTPIGNLKDITLRALDVLGTVDLIVCEDTRETRKLINHFSIKRPLISYERFSESKKLERILEQLQSGKNVAVVSDAGTPAISDPGAKLITKARERGIRVEALPGPSALVTALSASGFEAPFRFIGFFPRKKDMIKRELLRMSISTDVTIFYESPRRLLGTLRSITKHVQGRPICVAREISKIHEEYLVGPVHEVISQIEGRVIKGEVTVLVKGSENFNTLDEGTLKDLARALLHSGYSKKDVLHILSGETGIGRNEIYRMLIHLD
jgi:16S rRNA (cytidine1402-2'-O)-methyltransferase